MDFEAPWLHELQQQRAIAVIRTTDRALGHQLAHVVAAVGLRFLEIAWTGESTLALLKQLRQELPHCWLGVGTVLTVEQLQQAIAAGAQFGFSPHTAVPLLEQAQLHHFPLIPGALSPTEILQAQQAGAPCVKVFPIQAVGGASYLQALQGPLGHIPLIPTGGINGDNALSMLKAGAIAVGVSGYLFPKTAIAQRDWTTVTQRTQTLLQQVQAY